MRRRRVKQLARFVNRPLTFPARDGRLSERRILHRLVHVVPRVTRIFWLHRYRLLHGGDRFLGPSPRLTCLFRAREHFRDIHRLGKVNIVRVYLQPLLRNHKRVLRLLTLSRLVPDLPGHVLLLQTALLHPKDHFVSIGVGARPSCNYRVLRVFTLVFARDRLDILWHHDTSVSGGRAVIGCSSELFARIATPLRHEHGCVKLAVRSVVDTVSQVLCGHIVKTDPFFVNV